MAHGAHTKRLWSPHHTGGASRHTRGANQQQQQQRRPHLARIWLMVATVVLLYGFAPRLTYLSWALLVAFLLIAEFGALFEWPSWVTDISPFAHIPKLPAAPMAWGSILALLVLAAALIAAGTVRFRKRDLAAP